MRNTFAPSISSMVAMWSRIFAIWALVTPDHVTSNHSSADAQLYTTSVASPLAHPSHEPILVDDLHAELLGLLELRAGAGAGDDQRHLLAHAARDSRARGLGLALRLG